jgi:hypothetical protein
MRLNDVAGQNTAVAPRSCAVAGQTPTGKPLASNYLQSVVGRSRAKVNSCSPCAGVRTRVRAKMRFALLRPATALPSLFGYLDRVPVFRITGSRPNPSAPGSLCISFDCPCGERHSHGSEETPDRRQLLHRVAHCRDNRQFPAGYYLLVERSAP